ncbi:hypothetical protein ACFQRD_12820 [Brachybacterium sp. GCM10030268]|uniref:hypothetical protein n=1 Tax=Brachybacterium sp. GCM10030268 TaxID=3273382 RepID=UPI00361842C4
MTLIHPRSLERWQEWRGSRSRTDAARAAVAGLVRSARPGKAARRARESTGAAASSLVLHSRSGEGSGRILVGVDSATAAARDALLTALPYLHVPVDVLAPASIELPELAGTDWERENLPAARAGLEGRGITSAITLGWHLPVGRLVHEWALEADVPSAVVQHTAVTPYTPPLPPQTTLLAWSDADAEFHRSGRDDVEVRTVGSQWLWQAAHDVAGPAGPGRATAGPGHAIAGTGPAPDEAGTAAGESDRSDERPVFLGQLDALELPRRVTAGAAYSVCRSAGASYRPGPGERDPVARGVHTVLRRRGIDLEDPAATVAELGRPVVSVFSPEVLEAAVRGLPAWVHAPRAPSWVHEYWERYGMRRAGGPATPAPPVAADEPARLIAQILEGGA